MLHVCQEWRERALQQYQLCERTPLWPHPDWQRGQQCLKIKPFWFNAKIDTLYFGRLVAEWLGYVWARTDTFWTNGLLEGWQHVGFDLRASSWMSYTVYLPQAAGTVMTHPPAYKLREMIPSLKRISIVVDHSPFNCLTPFSNNVFFQSSTATLNYDGTLFVNQPGPRQWKEYLRTEYSAEEMPEVDVQDVTRNKERALLWDKWMKFHVSRRQ